MRSAIAHPRLETARLVLRELRLEDADFLLTEWSNPAVAHFFKDQEPLQTRSQVEDFLSSFQTPEKSPFARWWGIERKVDGQLIGTCGYFRWNRQHHRAEIGYDLRPEVWGQRLMPEALQALVRFGFEEMELNRIEATVHADNLRSQLVLLKLGFYWEGYVRECNFRDGCYYDQVQYSLLKREWLERRFTVDRQGSSYPLINYSIN